MKKKLYMVILVLAFALGTMTASLPAVKAEDPPVSIYIKDPADGDHIYPGLPPPAMKLPFPPYLTQWDVYISSPLAWMGTADGIVSYLLSVRVDPRAVELFDISVDTTGFTTFLELHAVMMSLSTSQAPAYKDIVSGTMWGFGNGMAPLPNVGGGGDPINGDDEMLLCRIRFYSNSETQASPIDLMGPGSIVDGVDVGFQYQNGRGDIIYVEPQDGYYVAETPYITFHDLNQPSSVIGSLWHELWPEYCLEWRIDSEEDGDEILEVSDQIDMMLLPLEDYKAWYHVEWVNPDPVAGDGKTDLIVLWKEDIPVPEFPLGIGLMMLLALAIPIVYIWRTRKKVRS